MCPHSSCSVVVCFPHKNRWGKYIGTHNLGNMEYLAEANGRRGRPQIDEQWIFRLRGANAVLGLTEKKYKNKKGQTRRVAMSTVALGDILKFRTQLQKMIVLKGENVKDFYRQYLLRRQRWIPSS